MRNRLFSAGRTNAGAKSCMASVTLRIMASIGSFSSESKVALRGVNQSRSLWRARARRNASPSGRRWAAVAAGAVFVARGIIRASLPDQLQSSPEKSVEFGTEGLVFGDGLFNRLLRCRPLITQVHQRGKHIV